MKTLADITPQTTKFYPKHPISLENLTTDDGEEIYLDVVGRDSDEYMQASQDFLKFLASLGDEADKLTSVEYKKQSSIQLSKLVTGWDKKFNPYMGGKFSTKLVEDILCNKNRWMSDQIDVFVSERSNFFTA